MEMIRPLFRSAKSLAKSAFTSNYLPLFYIIHDKEMTITRKFEFTYNIPIITFTIFILGHTHTTINRNVFEI